jgi:hypothetical protein
MRLINVETYQLEEFFGDNVPPYGILSHTWGDDEVTFQDMQNDFSAAQNKLGFAKIQGCIEVCEKFSLEYCWVDTCCIDKSSSAELSEAINSMYQWYYESRSCFVYLDDVHKKQRNIATGSTERLTNQGFQELVRTAKWWTRGWTLQELIAPTWVVFYDADWRYLGTKQICHKDISTITAIPESILLGADPGTASIAQRMSWASERHTTRREDMAYCLMGIFNVRMPLLYGEGMRAFTRLQEEIIKGSDDHSIFAWKSLEGSWWTHRGLLARSPAEFVDSGIIDPTHTRLSEPFSMTNKGLRISLLCCDENDDQQEFYALLDCKRREDETETLSDASLYAAVLLRRIWENSDQVIRVDPHKLVWKTLEIFAQRRAIYVRGFNSLPPDYVTQRVRGFVIEGPFLESYRYINTWPNCQKSNESDQRITLKIPESTSRPTTYKVVFGTLRLSKRLLVELQFNSTSAVVGTNEEVEQHYDLTSGPVPVRIVLLKDTYDIHTQPSLEDEYEETGDQSTKNLVDDLHRGEAMRAVTNKSRVQSNRRMDGPRTSNNVRTILVENEVYLLAQLAVASSLASMYQV